MTTSSGACARSISNLYWKPEQPPPSTLSRSMAPGGSRRRISPIRRAARSVTVRFSIRCVPSIQMIEPADRRSAKHIIRGGSVVSDSYVRRGHRSIGKSRRSSMAVEASHARAPYACNPGNSRGRLRPEPPSPTRNAFRRDCDRIIHATAFRRLAHKTQVFVFYEGDHFRTRLTHTLEVAQIARALARALGLDEDLAEALALAHDLGHPPFGHAGERALDRCLKGCGGFDHNAQTLRVVTALERRYAAFDGLNLTWETLEGLVKHNGPLTDRCGEAIGRHRARGLPPPIRPYAAMQDLELWRFASAEAQLAAIADDIAYDAHDIDDGLRAELFALDDLAAEVALVRDLLGSTRASHPTFEPARAGHELVRALIAALIEDVIA